MLIRPIHHHSLGWLRWSTCDKRNGQTVVGRTRTPTGFAGMGGSLESWDLLYTFIYSVWRYHKNSNI